jgi:hypothetical protein
MATRLIKRIKGMAKVLTAIKATKVDLTRAAVAKVVKGIIEPVGKISTATAHSCLLLWAFSL